MNKGISAVVDIFRSVPGVMQSGKDGSIIAGLCGRYGSSVVLKCIEEMSLELGAADNPLLYLVHVMKKTPKPLELQRPKVLETNGMTNEQRAANIKKLSEMVGQVAGTMGRRKR